MINPILENIFIISLSCSGIALLLLAVRKLIGKNTGAWWRSMLWMLLLLRLCIPVIIESPIGIISSELNSTAIRQISTIDSGSSNNAETEEYNNVNEVSIPSMSAEIEEVQSSFSADNQMNNPNSFSPISLVNQVYLLGLIISILVLLVRIIILNTNVKRLKRLRDREVFYIFEQVKKRLGIRRNISVVIEIKDSVPALCGLIAPVIIIPQSAITKSSQSELEYIFIHELTHYKRGDILKLWFLEIVSCIHWFNPLIHLIKPTIVQDIELACDEKIISNIGSSEYANYGSVLVNCSTRNRSKHPLVVTSNFAGKRGNKLKERLVMIKRFNKKRIIPAGIILVLAISTVLVACSTSSKKDNQKFDSASVSIAYSDEVNANIDTEYTDLLIEQLNNESSIEVSTDSIDMTEKNDFAYTIYTEDNTFEMFRLDCIYDQIYIAQADDTEKLYYYNSSVIGDLLDEIEGDYIKQYEITRYDDMVLDIVCNLIDGKRTIENVVSNDEWTYEEAAGIYTTKMYLYSHISVIFSLNTGDDDLNRNLDYSKDVLTVDYAEEGGELINPTSDELMEYLFDSVGESNELSEAEIIELLNLYELGDFSCGLAAARADNGLLGFVDAYGNWIVEPIYDAVYDFSENVARVGIASDELKEEVEANREEYEREEYESESEFVNTADSWGYVNIDGEIIAEVKYEHVNQFENGYGFIWDSDSSVGAYIDYDGNVVLSSDNLPTELDGFGLGQNVRSDGTIIIEKEVDKDGDYIYYQSIIDINGNLIFDGEKMNISSVSDEIYGYRIAQTNDKIDGSTDTGVINNQNEWVINPVYDEIEFISEEKLIMTRVMDNGEGLESGIYNIASGQWLIEPDGKYIFDYGFDMIVFYTMTDSQWMELYNTSNEILLGGKSYQSIEILTQDLVITKENDSTPYTLTQLDGTNLVDEYNVEYAQNISTTVIAVYVYDYEEGEYNTGLLDENGEWLLEPKYDRLLSFDGDTGKGIIIDYEKSDDSRTENRKIVFHIEEFDLLGNVLSVGEEITMDYDDFQELYPFYLE